MRPLFALRFSDGFSGCRRRFGFDLFQSWPRRFVIACARYQRFGNDNGCRRCNHLGCFSNGSGSWHGRNGHYRSRFHFFMHRHRFWCFHLWRQFYRPGLFNRAIGNSVLCLLNFSLRFTWFAFTTFTATTPTTAFGTWFASFT